MSLLLKGFAEEDRKVLLGMQKRSNVALCFSIASLIVSIAAIIIAIWR